MADYSVTGDADAEVGEESSPLLGAVLDGDLPLAALLLEQGADPSWAVKNSWASFLRGSSSLRWRISISNSSVSPPPRGSSLLLVHACQQENADMVELLLNSGANPNLRDNHGRTAIGVERLYSLTSGGFNDNARRIFNLLLKQDAPIISSACNRQGQTPVQLACLHGNYLAADFLMSNHVAAGCDVITATAVSTCIRYACCSGSAETLRLLLDAGLRPPKDNRVTIPDVEEGRGLCGVLLNSGIRECVIRWAIRNEQFAFLDETLRECERSFYLLDCKDSLSATCWLILVRGGLMDARDPPRNFRSSLSNSREQRRPLELLYRAMRPYGNRLTAASSAPVAGTSSTSQSATTAESGETRQEPATLFLLSAAAIRNNLAKVKTKRKSESLFSKIGKLPIPEVMKARVRYDDYADFCCFSDKSLPSINHVQPVMAMMEKSAAATSLTSPDTWVIFTMLSMAFLAFVLHFKRSYSNYEYFVS